MAHKLLIIMLNSDPAKASELTTPLFQAGAAAAMEYDAEIILAGPAGVLAVKGVAEKIPVAEGDSKTVYDALKEAHEAGVTFKVCVSTEQWGDDLIPEIEEVVGGAYLISETMDDDTVTFTY